MPKTMIPAVLLFCLASAGGSVTVAAQSKYVYMVRIPASRNHKAVLQTGFRLEGRKGIVTALHGVADGTTFSAFNESGDALKDLTIAAVDFDNDLALLRSAELENRPPEGLPFVASLTLQPGDTLRALGHPSGINQYIKTVTAGTPVEKKLHMLVPPDSAQIFDQRKSPSTNISVLSIAGSLVPGDSGAPVLNANNQVVGIVNGGLLSGAAAISWAIPITAVQWRDIASARIKLAELARLDTNNLFAFSEDTAVIPPSVNCFNSALSLKYLRLQNWVTVTEDEIPATQGETVFFWYDTTGGTGYGEVTYSCEASVGAVRIKKDSSPVVCLLDTTAISSQTAVTVKIKAASQTGNCLASASAQVNVTPFIEVFRTAILDLVAATRVQFKPIERNCHTIQVNPTDKGVGCDVSIQLPGSLSGSITKYLTDSSLDSCSFSMKVNNDRSPTKAESEYNRMIDNLRQSLPSDWQYTTDDKALRTILRRFKAVSPDGGVTVRAYLQIYNDGTYHMSVNFGYF